MCCSFWINLKNQIFHTRDVYGLFTAHCFTLFTLLTSHVFCYLIIQAQGNQLEKSQGIDMKLMKYSFVF